MINKLFGFAVLIALALPQASFGGEIGNLEKLTGKRMQEVSRTYEGIIGKITNGLLDGYLLRRKIVKRDSGDTNRKIILQIVKDMLKKVPGTDPDSVVVWRIQKSEGSIRDALSTAIGDLKLEDDNHDAFVNSVARKLFAIKAIKSYGGIEGTDFAASSFVAFVDTQHQEVLIFGSGHSE